jgi:hypothetical protein
MTRWRRQLSFALATCSGGGMPAAALAQEFVPDDVEVCPGVFEVRDPEILVRRNRIVFMDAAGQLKVSKLGAGGTLGNRGCLGQVIDDNLAISLPGVTFKNGAEWAQSEAGAELYYAKLGSSGEPILARARLVDGTWQTELLTGGTHRAFPIATMNKEDEQPAILYWRLNEDLSTTTLWRFADDPDSEREYPGFIGPNTGGNPRWVRGMRAITTVVPDEFGIMQAAIHYVDAGVTEVLTNDATPKDEVWMWQAPEFGDEWVFSTIVSGTVVRIYRKLDGFWQVVHSFSGIAPFNRIYSPEPFTYEGRSYLAMQFATSVRYGPSNIWIASIDPEQPLLRQLSQPGTIAVRNEPEWYADEAGAYVYYTEVTPSGFSLHRATTGL